MSQEILSLLEGIASQPSSHPKGVITREQAQAGVEEIRALMVKADNFDLERHIGLIEERGDVRSVFARQATGKLSQ